LSERHRKFDELRTAEEEWIKTGKGQGLSWVMKPKGKSFAWQNEGNEHTIFSVTAPDI